LARRFVDAADADDSKDFSNAIADPPLQGERLFTALECFLVLTPGIVEEKHVVECLAFSLLITNRFRKG